MATSEQTSTQELELEKGREYQIVSLLSESGNTRYLGCKDFGYGEVEIFANKDLVILAKKYELKQRGEGIISYTPGRSVTQAIPRDAAMGMDDLAKLIQDSEAELEEMETLLEQKPELIKGKEYEIEIYPHNYTRRAKYLGEKFLQNHQFAVFGNKESFILAKKDELEQREDDIVGYIPIIKASFIIEEILRAGITRNERLIKSLEESLEESGGII